ncbi:MAG: hypothetical protein DRH04_07585 [Deltaproteobacteria bacterium]|nr:MAG: hypothetical protein DRH04_07585 [Deltaproteobacteria bacterium]
MLLLVLHSFLGQVNFIKNMRTCLERKPIFKDYQDCRNFLERLGNILTETSTPCVAWALMTNHVHLLLRTMLLTGWWKHSSVPG